MTKYIKYFFAASLVFILTIPFQKEFLVKDGYKERFLSGYFPPVEKPILSFKNLLEGKFQQQAEQHIKRNFGIRHMFVRVNNELQYRLWKNYSNKGVVEGKNGYLFEDGYIRSYMGLNYKGASGIGNMVKKLKLVNDIMSEYSDVKIAVALVPSKIEFYPEYLPEQFDLPKPRTTKNNYFELKEQMLQNDMPFIDINQYFLDMKADSEYPLFTRLGTHWSEYGVVFGIDTLVRYISELTDLDLPNVNYEYLNPSTKEEGTDIDIGKAANFLSHFPETDTFGYFGQILPLQDSVFEKPKVILDGDSFVFNIWGRGIQAFYFTDDSQYWYYFNDGYSVVPNPDLEGKIREKDYRAQIEDSDVLMIVSNVSQLSNLGFDLFEHLYNEFGGIYDQANTDWDAHYLQPLDLPGKLGYKIKKAPPKGHTIIRKSNIELEAGKTYDLRAKMELNAPIRVKLTDVDKILLDTIFSAEVVDLQQDIIVKKYVEKAILTVETVNEPDSTQTSSSIYNLFFFKKSNQEK